MPIAEKNKKKLNAMDTYAEVARCAENEVDFAHVLQKTTLLTCY